MFCVLCSVFRLSDISCLQGCKQLAVHLYIVWECGIVVSLHNNYFPSGPPRAGGGVQISTVVLYGVFAVCVAA